MLEPHGPPQHRALLSPMTANGRDIPAGLRSHQLRQPCAPVCTYPLTTSILAAEVQQSQWQARQHVPDAAASTGPTAAMRGHYLSLEHQRTWGWQQPVALCALPAPRSHPALYQGRRSCPQALPGGTFCPQRVGLPVLPLGSPPGLEGGRGHLQGGGCGSNPRGNGKTPQAPACACAPPPTATVTCSLRRARRAGARGRQLWGIRGWAGCATGLRAGCTRAATAQVKCSCRDRAPPRPGTPSAAPARRSRCVAVSGLCLPAAGQRRQALTRHRRRRPERGC